MTAALKGGTLSWLIQPFTDEPRAADLQLRQGDAAELPRGAAARAAPGCSSGSRGRDGPAESALRLRRRGALSPDDCTALLRVFRGGRAGGPDDQARASVEPGTRHTRSSASRPAAGRALRGQPGPLRLTFRATVREPSGAVTRRSARVRLR